jgi:DNA-binding MarR family transcriptional regulator
MLVRLLEREQLVRRERDPDDGRAYRIVLTGRARTFEPVAERTLAELGAFALDRLGERQFASVKNGLKEWIQP